MILDEAYQAVRLAVESRYSGRCTVAEWAKTTDPITKLTKQGERVVITDQPCRLVYKTLAAATETDTAPTLTQGVKLLLAPELTVKPGSRITVTQAGQTADFATSGQPAAYQTHQEIMLALWRGWS